MDSFDRFVLGWKLKVSISITPKSRDFRRDLFRAVRRFVLVCPFRDVSILEPEPKTSKRSISLTGAAFARHSLGAKVKLCPGRNI